MAEILKYRFLVRGGLAAAIAALNEVPLARELVIETDTLKMKLGDGATPYNSLPYTNEGTSIHTVTAAPANSLGVDGDYAIWNTSAGPVLYGPKAGGAWPAGVPLYGTATTIHSVTSAPANSLGVDGDFAIWYATSGPILYGPKAGGVWPSGVPLKGADGVSSGEILVADGVSPPTMLTNENETDFLYEG